MLYAISPECKMLNERIFFLSAQPLVSAPSTSTAALGNRATLVCDASGYPSPDISWYRKDGEMPRYMLKKVNKGTKMQITLLKYILICHNVKPWTNTVSLAACVDELSIEHCQPVFSVQ